MKGFGVWHQRIKITRSTDSSAMSGLSSEKQGPKKNIFKISVEGNVGSGKSKILDYFKRFPFIEAHDEPIEKWRNLRGYNFLNLHYEDMQMYSASFQSYVQLTRIQLQVTPPKKGALVQMFERSVQNNRYCFLENGFQTGFIHPVQYNVLVEWYEWIRDNIDISLDAIVYLKTSPEVVQKRIWERNRLEEKSITYEYIKSLHLSHEEWLNNINTGIPVYFVDADKPFDDVIKAIKEKIPELFDEESAANLARRSDL